MLLIWSAATWPAGIPVVLNVEDHYYPSSYNRLYPRAYEFGPVSQDIYATGITTTNGKFELNQQSSSNLDKFNLTQIWTGFSF